MQASLLQRQGAGSVVKSSRPAPLSTRPCPALQQRPSRSAGRRASVNVRASSVTFPTVEQTKKKFIHGYKKPIAGIYNAVLQELLVQMHFIRFNLSYEYNEVFALGVVSVFEQILESFPSNEREVVFKAYIEALDEKPDTFKADAARLEQTTAALSGPEQLTPDANGSDVQKTLARVAERSAKGEFGYNKFFAIGLFRLLELTGAKDPAALEQLVKATGVKPENVNRDLMLYKSILSKLNAAKELMAEFVQREKKKQAEREADKAARAAKEASGQDQSPVQSNA
mmetsp:Transcript_385/g.967  ORF Transcript_385/g.967 Transcript_385/m.967 type:complete len:284 (+) Transcript_385:62-913(+)|eukprot:CAMPEP_0202345610 /NCGR_PEP_ID=MMETSP1126-20121109/4775_1 /ASSEMBLY_ACC=CAM_ASM_000457 /TAXON_ID=3047 /ORGANISM="Dunaliella tertiolecta, Strain CCMP1320" /LENGTH=283 /DNA_ID=CAMNT_0048936939 /DNA_START=44 /DNA_END=895 /DNA_ORIENTATION=-